MGRSFSTATPVNNSNLELSFLRRTFAPVRRAIEFLFSACLFVSVGLHASEKPTSSPCQSAVPAFFKAPDGHRLITLDELSCWTVIGSSNDNLNRLNYLVETGNRWAAQYSAEHLKELDGGNLEDALIALGQFSNHDAQRLLLFANNGLLSKRELTDALTMLPLSLSDNPHAQLISLQSRRDKVMRVTRADLQKQRAQALAAIDTFVSEITSRN